VIGRARIAALLAVLAVSAGCSSSSSHSRAPVAPVGSSERNGPPSTTAPACVRPHPPGQFAQTFTFQGQARTYQLYVPGVYTGRRDVPLVFDFHGFGSNAVQQMVYGNFKPEADRDDFLIVAPDGQDPQDRHFNLTAQPGLQNDVQMVGALLTHIESTLCVDAHRVYATGMSDGGAMTSVLACEMSNRFAAFGAVAVILACGATKPVPIMAFSGTADPIVPFYGGTVNCCGHSHLGSAPAAMAGWATTNHCSPAYHDLRQSSEVIRRTWTGCAGTSAAVFYMIIGGGHTWPGSIAIPRLGMTTKQIDASATIWRFFQRHALA
jgi:polyhydroxybutyrate depolymerase